MFWNILSSMGIYSILFEHMAKSINCPKKSLVCSQLPSLDLRTREVKIRIYYLRDDH